jgi:hypothetical protein
MATQISFRGRRKTEKWTFGHPSRRNLEPTYPTWATVNQQHPSCTMEDGWMDGCMYVCMYGWMDGWMDGWCVCGQETVFHYIPVP